MIASDIDGLPPPENTPEHDAFMDRMRESNKEISLDELKEILDSTIKHDNESKIITFLDMLLNYTKEDQQNIGYVAESSTGKSYIPLQLTPYFPKDDVIELGRVNPTAFFHEWGISTVDPRDKRDIEEEKKHRIVHIDLKQKILVFLDNPHSQLLQNLRPLLSHDRPEIEVRNVDRSKSGSHRTNTYILHGFPTVIFCTANDIS